VGYGLAGGLLFFHESMVEMNRRAKEGDRQYTDDKERTLLPPSISAVLGAKTANGTWAAGGFHFGSWKKDHLRYTGGLARTSVNLTFYGGPDTPVFQNGLEYNLDGWILYQELLARMGESNAFAGGRLTYFDSSSTFKIGEPVAGIDNWELDYDNLGLGFVFRYDSRDNIFTPDRGYSTDISSMYYTGTGILRERREYQMTDAANRAWWSLRPDLILGWRLSGRFSSGEVPFFALPFIQLRGIPVMRYQNNLVMETEVEARYQVTERWGLVGFGGVGKAFRDMSDFGATVSQFAAGVGFRYLTARVLRMHTGIDIAKGPEEWVLYIQVGSGL
jgi:hypothetical protein